ncbi:MAG: hypothetical protein OXC98_11175 [bacterium]|nr:hypothetical protein [Acidimicrobiia bacterium]MCY4650911.1 hypothetical protein [bacterium]
MNRPSRLLVFSLAAALASVGSAACAGDDDTALVTTTSRVVTTAAPTTTAPPLETTTTTAPTTTAAEPAEDAQTSPLESGEIEYQLVRQVPTRDGNLVFLEIPAGDYTDIDLENLVLSVYEERDDLYELHVVDNGDVVDVLVKAEEERTPEEKELLDRHYLVSLLEGSVLRFQGPFANLEGFIIGS